MFPKKLLSFLVLLAGSSTTFGNDATSSWMDEEVITGPNTDGSVADVTPETPTKMRKGVRQLGGNKNNKNTGGGGGGGASPARAPTVKTTGTNKVPVGKDNSGTTVWTKMNGGGGVPDGTQSTTGDFTGNYIVDRTHTTPGIPVASAAGCTGVDTVVTDYGNYQLTRSKCGVLEKAQCTNPYTITTDTKNDYRTNPSCLDGTCGGCCRDYKYLECDRDGTLLNPFVPCVCSMRTYGGLNGFTSTGSGSVPIPVPVVPVVPAPAPLPVVTTPTAPVAAPTSRVVSASSTCSANAGQRPWWGKGLGEKPNTTPALPAGAAPGECTSSAHCAGTPGNCCMTSFCLCGSGPNCLA